MRTGLLALVMAVASVAPARADLIVMDLRAAGDGLVTFDTATGLEWLDLTVTAGQSYDAVRGAMGAGLLSGFRFATQAEVLGLLGTAGAPIPTEFGTDVWLNFAFGTGDSLVDRFGQTGLISFPTERATAGLVAVDFGNPLNVLMYEVQAGLFRGTEPISRIRADFTGSHATGGYGIFVVRPASVPEPSTLALVAIGSIAAIASRHRRWRSSSR